MKSKARAPSPRPARSKRKKLADGTAGLLVASWAATLGFVVAQETGQASTGLRCDERPGVAGAISQFIDNPMRNPFGRIKCGPKIGPGDAVPYIAQKPKACSPTSLAMLATPLGVEPQLSNASRANLIASAAGTTQNGTYLEDLVDAASKLGMHTEVRFGSLDQDWLKAQLKEGKGVLLSGDYASLASHPSLPFQHSDHTIAVVAWLPEQQQYEIRDPGDKKAGLEDAKSLASFIEGGSGDPRTTLTQIAVSKQTEDDSSGGGDW